MPDIIIKPHHFMDIIKLYGSGIEVFVPDENMGHDFYKAANEIIKNHQIQLQLTIDGDDICRPCRMYQNKRCIDKVYKPGYEYKNDYNQTLDKRLIENLNLCTERDYSADELCQIMLAHHDCIFQVWQEEEDIITQKRHDLFVLGAQKFIK
ncbi:MAG: hypothetical protein QM657_08380 [Lacrimispora sp.]|uniref:hypothetical protein n=1 Tax=Lacrimispora sp. TaxID=2719234 RepID=UPI0039E2CFC8